MSATRAWFLSSEGGARIPLPLGARVVAGRAADATLPLPNEDHLASRYHATLSASAAFVEVIDLESVNGVFVNDRRKRTARLAEGDRVRLGATTFRLVAMEVEDDALGEASPAKPAAALFGTIRPVPYVCETCGREGPTPAMDHDPAWTDVSWICSSCADARRTDAATWDVAAPSRIGEFELLRFLARGGMAAVFEARHARGGIRAAVKLMLPDRALDPAALRRFVREQRIAMGLISPRITRTLAVGTADGRAFVAAELVARGDAFALAGRDSDVRAVVTIAADIFEALAHAHARGVVHRDVKPSNVLVDVHGRGKLTDFGLAKNFRAVGGTVLTKEGEVGGTAMFVAPEQLLGFRDVGPTADVYSAAASVYFMLTGEVPLSLGCAVEHATDPQICLAALSDERVPLAKRRAVHPILAQWIDTLVARDHARRAHLTAEAVSKALRAAVI